MMPPRAHPSRAAVAHGLVVAGLLVAASAAIARLSPHLRDPALAHRLLGALIGIVVIVFANAVPATLPPLAQLRCDPAADQSLRRFVGWILSLAGVAYVVVWLAAPVDRAPVLGASVLGAAVALVAARTASRLVSRPRRQR